MALFTFKLFAEEDVFLGLVREDQSDLGLVGRVRIDRLKDLPHRSDAGSTGDQGDRLC